MSISHDELKRAQQIARNLRITQEREDEINPHPEELHRTAEKAARLIEEWALRLEWQQRDLERMRLLTRKQGESPWTNSCIHDAEELLQKTQQLENENAALRVELQEQCALNGTGSEREYVLRGRVDRLKRENAALREDRDRLDDVLASFYPAVAPLVEHYPVTPWEHMKDGRCRGSWAEDGSPYYFTVPHQLVPAFFALQRLAKLCRDKDAARAKEAQL